MTTVMELQILKPSEKIERLEAIIMYIESNGLHTYTSYNECKWTIVTTIYVGYKILDPF